MGVLAYAASPSPWQAQGADTASGLSFSWSNGAGHKLACPSDAPVTYAISFEAGVQLVEGVDTITRAWTAEVPSGNTSDIFRTALRVVEIQHSFPSFPALTVGRHASGYRP